MRALVSLGGSLLSDTKSFAADGLVLRAAVFGAVSTVEPALVAAALSPFPMPRLKANGAARVKSEPFVAGNAPIANFLQVRNTTLKKRSSF